MEEFRDSIRYGTKSAVFQILTEMHRELMTESNKGVVQQFWNRFRLIGYSKIKRAVDLYLHGFGYYELNDPETFGRMRNVDQSKHIIGIGIFLINQIHRV